MEFTDTQKSAVQKVVNQLEPVGDHIICLQMEEDTITQGGLVIPETASNAGTKRGFVVKTGPGIWQNGSFKPMPMNFGDVIYFNRGKLGNEQVIHEVKYDGVEFTVVPEAIVVWWERSKD